MLSTSHSHCLLVLCVYIRCSTDWVTPRRLPALVMPSTHPSATLYSPAMTMLQNAPYNHVFFASFLVALLLSGVTLRLLFSLLLAFLVSCLYQYLLQPLQPVPPRCAVLVTGAGGGLGALMAERLAGLGVTVFAGVRKAADGDKLRQRAGRNIVPVVFDVTKQAEVDAACQSISSQLAKSNLRLYALINNAGFGAHGPLELISPERLRGQFDTNVLSVVAVTQTFLPLLRAGATPSSESRIVLLSSVAGHVTLAGSGPYSSSKHALEAIGNAMRIELGRFHIRTTLIEPVNHTTHTRTQPQHTAQPHNSRCTAACLSAAALFVTHMRCDTRCFLRCFRASFLPASRMQPWRMWTRCWTRRRKMSA